MNEEDYRSRLDAAIDALPEEQIRIMTMLAHGMQIENKTDPDRPTITKVLGRSEKHVRNHRNKAFETIRSLLERDERK